MPAAGDAPSSASKPMPRMPAPPPVPPPQWAPATVPPPVHAARPTGGLARALVWLVAATLGFGFVNFIVLLTADLGTGLILLLGMVSFLLSVPTIIVFCVWLHHTLSNARDRNPQARIRPGWAVGSFFVPFVQFVAPYFEVKRGWTADTGRGVTLVAVWFVAWSLTGIIGGVAGGVGAVANIRASYDAADDADGPDVREEAQKAQLKAMRPFQVVTVPLHTLAGVALILLVRQWTALQEGRPAS